VLLGGLQAGLWVSAISVAALVVGVLVTVVRRRRGLGSSASSNDRLR
jgi:heme exporter protein D